MIETSTARLAADQTDGDTGELLSASTSHMAQAWRNGQQAEFSRADAEFHRLVVQASDNHMLQHLHRIVTARDTTPHATTCHPGTTTLAHHEAVTQTILNHDANAAEQAMRTLLAGPARRHHGRAG